MKIRIVSQELDKEDIKELFGLEAAQSHEPLRDTTNDPSLISRGGNLASILTVLTTPSTLTDLITIGIFIFQIVERSIQKKIEHNQASLRTTKEHYHTHVHIHLPSSENTRVDKDISIELSNYTSDTLKSKVQASLGMHYDTPMDEVEAITVELLCEDLDSFE